MLNTREDFGFLSAEKLHDGNFYTLYVKILK